MILRRASSFHIECHAGVATRSCEAEDMNELVLDVKGRMAMGDRFSRPSDVRRIPDPCLYTQTRISMGKPIAVGLMMIIDRDSRLSIRSPNSE